MPGPTPSQHPVGLFARLENGVNGLAATRDAINHEIAQLQNEQTRAQAELAKAFPHHDALTDARRRSTQLAAELTESPNPRPKQPAADGAHRPQSADRHPLATAPNSHSSPRSRGP